MKRQGVEHRQTQVLNLLTSVGLPLSRKPQSSRRFSAQDHIAHEIFR
jgi:hypothetical protein